MNGLRGETTLTADDGTEYHIVYTVEALMMIETKVQVGPLDLMSRALNQQLTMTELTTVLWAGMEAWRRCHGGGGKPVNPASALKVVSKCGGYLPVMVQVANSLGASQALGIQNDDDDTGGDAEDPTGTGDEPSI